MSWQVTSIDRAALPLALLTTVKAHCRVDFAEDDAILKTYIAIALGQLEKVWGWQIFGLDGKWTPPGAPTETPNLDRWPTPVLPISSQTAIDEGGANSSALFEIINKGAVTTDNYIGTVDQSAFPAGHTFTLKAGFATEAEIPPEALGAILQVTARLYEYRENVASFAVNAMPFWLNDMLVGLWQPRA